MTDYLIDFDLFGLGWLIATVDDGVIVNVSKFDDPINTDIWSTLDSFLRQSVTTSIRGQDMA